MSGSPASQVARPTPAGRTSRGQRARSARRQSRCAPRSGSWLGWALLWGLWGPLGLAGPAGDDVLSQLRPPKPLLGPSFWEQHGAVVLAVAVGLVVAAGLVVLWWWRHIRSPKKTLPVPPHLQARRALAAVRASAEDERLAAEVSRVLRHYVREAFQLPPGEWTTAELHLAVRQHPQAGLELADALAELLRDCDVVKFAPVRPAEPRDLVARALDLIDRLEQGRSKTSPSALNEQSAGSGRALPFSH